jgi:ABC-type transport system involved in Fe-S cluster assembly fused permease/ATPase subunit
MSVTYKKLFEPTILTTSAATIFTLNSSAGAVDSTILENLVLRVMNYTAGAITVSGYAIASGGTASDDEYFCKAMSIPANDYALVTVPVMAFGGFIQMLASSNTSITVHHESGLPKTP